MTTQHGPLSATDLLPDGPLRRLGTRLFLHDTLESTNAFLLARATEARDGTVAWTEFQSAGRGRLGRRWQAPRSSSVLLSVLLIEPADSPLLELAGLLAALATCEAIDATTECTPAVRWPNDVTIGGRKVSGVLAESSVLVDAGGGAVRRALVIGVGINCLQHRGHFPLEIADIATSLEIASPQPINRAAVAARLLARLDHWLHAAVSVTGGWGDLRAAWRAWCQDFGTRVTLEQDGREHRGTALDVADDGSLIVQLDHGGRRQFASATTTRVW
jgi:BirA family biotin operon repressor/biotin-[acetyl-CoA-carboxylase] ligase